MAKKGKGFSRQNPVLIQDSNVSKAAGSDEQEVLTNQSKQSLDKVRRFLEAGKAAIAAADTATPKPTAKAITVTDAADTQESTPAEEPTPTEEPAAESSTERTPAADSVQLSKDDLSKLVSAAVKSALEGEREQSNAEAAKLQERIDALQKQVDDGKGLAAIIKSLEGLSGNPVPAKSTDANGQPDRKPITLSIEGTGSPESRQYEKLVQSAPTMRVKCKRFGAALQKDTRQADRYFKANQDKIRDGVQAILKDAGLLGGSGPQVVEAKDAVTGVSDIPSLAYEYLSAAMRVTHYEDLIHWQFARTETEIGTKPGLTMGIARYNYLSRPSAFTDRVLTPGTRLDGGRQSLTELIVPVTIQELGLGKDSSNQALGISTFVDTYSLHDLEAIVEMNLGRDYQYTKDLGLRSEWFRTTNAVYNDGGAVTNTATNVDTGDDGTMTDRFTIALEAYAKRLQILPYDGVHYALVMNTTAAEQFLASKSTKERDAALESGRDMVSRAIAQTTGDGSGAEVSGYLGLYNNLHMFRQNVYGNPGGTEGVNTVTLGAGPGATEMLSSFLVGRDTICWGTALPMEIRVDTNDDFQREQAMIWYSHETPESLDVTTTPATGEQLRVIEVRTSGAVL